MPRDVSAVPPQIRSKNDSSSELRKYFRLQEVKIKKIKKN